MTLIRVTDKISREKKYFDKEGVESTFTGHPLLEDQSKSKVDISQIIKDNKKIFSIYPGSRLSEIDALIPILFEFVKKMNDKYKDLFFVFHSTSEHVQLIQNLLLKKGFKSETISTAMEALNMDSRFDAALRYARRRRLGPYRTDQSLRKAENKNMRNALRKAPPNVCFCGNSL